MGDGFALLPANDGGSAGHEEVRGSGGIPTEGLVGGVEHDREVYGLPVYAVLKLLFEFVDCHITPDITACKLFTSRVR